VLDAGTRLGRYEIHSPLGAGGMGEVYLARDTRLDRSVALKILPDAVAADPDRMRRFEQEARTASSLNHPNIITIYDVDRSGSTSFMATEFIEGSTLLERTRAGPLGLAEVLNLSVQIAAALTAAHASGIVHRDIKPANIILRNDGLVKVLDFGLAKLTGAGSPESGGGDATRAHVETESGVVMGTATYMSPEQARGQRVDARTDIFSLGVVLYELLTGHLPYEGTSIYEIVASILSDREAPPLSSYSSAIPAELERIVGKALRKDPDRRYQTVRDFLVDLQALGQRLEFERTHPSTSTPDEQAATAGRLRPRRMPPRLLVVVCALLALVGQFAHTNDSRIARLDDLLESHCRVETV